MVVRDLSMAEHKILGSQRFPSQGWFEATSGPSRQARLLYMQIRMYKMMDQVIVWAREYSTLDPVLYR